MAAPRGSGLKPRRGDPCLWGVRVGGSAPESAPGTGKTIVDLSRAATARLLQSVPESDEVFAQASLNPVHGAWPGRVEGVLPLS